MLRDANVAPTLPVVNMDRAEKFYGETLGLKLVNKDVAGVTFECGDSQLYLYEREATKADHTVASFRVDDVEAEINDLRAKGVRFEEYDLPNLKTENGVATLGDLKVAWFKDSEGNILAVSNG